MVRIIIDKRELRSSVAIQLEKLNCNIEFDTLEVGDYVVSDRCAFERKTVEDFLKSWLDEKKLFGQLIDLCAYERPILIIEGQYDDLFTARMTHPHSVQGVLNTIAMLRIPMLLSMNAAETAFIIKRIATSEQVDEKRPLYQHGKRSHMNSKAQKEYIVSAISNIGPVVARNLLEHFGSIQDVFNAEVNDLTTVDLVGPKTAAKIREVVGGKY
jgi:ERCC4-type nuclease